MNTFRQRVWQFWHHDLPGVRAQQIVAGSWAYEWRQALRRARDPQWISTRGHAPGLEQQRALSRCQAVIAPLLGADKIGGPEVQEAHRVLLALIAEWDAGPDGVRDEDGFGTGTLRAVLASVRRAAETLAVSLEPNPA